MGNKTTHHHHHDDSGARDHQYRMQQLANSAASQRESYRDQQQAAAAEASRQHSYRMQQLAKQKQLEMEKEQERQRAAKRLFEQKMKEMKLKEKTDAINRVKSGISHYQNINNNLQNKLTNDLNPKLIETEKELKKTEKSLEIFTENSTKKLNEIDKVIKKYTEKYRISDNKIRDVILKTNVDEGDIPQFLNLVNDGLLFATMRGQQEQDKMTAKLKVFAELIERTCYTKLEIKTYFKDQSLERFIPILKEEGYNMLDDIKCTDNEEWNELKIIMDDGLKINEKEKKKQKMKSMERNKLKKICLEPDRMWIPQQMDKIHIIRSSLMTAAPKLSNFFGVLHNVITEIDELLTYESKLTLLQQKAINSPPKIEEKHDDDDNKEDLVDIKDKNEREIWDKNSECLIYSKSDNIWCFGKIIDIIYDDKGEWLEVQYNNENNNNNNNIAIKPIGLRKVQRFSKDIKPIGLRNQWKTGSKVEIFSKSEEKWYAGTIQNIQKDNSKLLQVEYFINNKSTKDIVGRYSPEVRSYIIKDDNDNGDEYTQSKDVSIIKFKQDDINNTNKQCNALANVVITKLHITESLIGDFTVDKKEIERLENMINSELIPKQKELKNKQEQIQEIDDHIQLTQEEIEMLDEIDSEDDDEKDSDDEDEDDEELTKKELKKKRKKLKLKRKKVQLTIIRLEKGVKEIKSKRGLIVSMEDVLAEAFVVANNIQDSCLQIIKSQCITRQSILLARELLKYKPAKPKTEAKPLWETITNGIGDIFENALNLSKISAVYFGFFIKFQHSFHHFVTSNKMKENVSLLIASENLIKDVSEIQLFQKQIDGKVNKLRESAIKTIRDCVSNTAGAQEFETAMNQRQIAEKELRAENKKYNIEKYKIDDEFQLQFSTQQQFISKRRIIQYQMEEIKKNHSINQQWIQQLGNQLVSLESKMVV